MTGHQVLWIDDEIDTDNPAVALLAGEGLHISCAHTGMQGIASAKAHAYGAIILDLRLPDLPGIAVLGVLAGLGIAAPVMVLTGYAEDDEHQSWKRLGAVALYRKPLHGDSLTEAVLRCVSAYDENRVQTAKLVSNDVRLRLMEERLPKAEARRTMERLLDTSVGAIEFARAADHLRLLFTGLTHRRDPNVLPCLCGADGIPAIPRASVNAILASIDSMLLGGKRPSESEVGATMHLSPSRIGHLLLGETGRGFREWRSIHALRHTLPEVATGTEQISQLAYFGAAMEHPNQFAREFRALFGLSPRELRKWYRSAR